MKTWITAVIVLIAIRVVSAWSVFGKAEKKGSELRFNLNTPFRVAEIGLYGILLGLLVTPLLVGDWQEKWWQMVLVTAGTVSAVLFLPTPISIDQNGISQNRMFRRLHINWNDVESIIKDTRHHRITVTSKTGIRIAHSEIHVAENQFVKEVERSSRMKAVEESEKLSL